MQQTTTAYTIATGQNPVTDALDMVVLSTMSHMAIEDGTLDEELGERVSELREAYAVLEPESWELLDGAVSPEQIKAVRSALQDWRAKNPHVTSVSYVHFRDFVSSPEAEKSREVGGSTACCRCWAWTP